MSPRPPRRTYPAGVSRADTTRGEPGDSVVVVVVAGAANLLIALTKAIAGALGNSSAMLSEAAHSLADTTTEVLLFVALRRGSRPADAAHPLGYGKESFFWGLHRLAVHVRRRRGVLDHSWRQLDHRRRAGR